MTEIGSKSKRWIAVSVDQASHPVVGMHRPPPKPADPKRHAVAPYVAWQMLLIEAAWQDHKTVVGNTPITIKRGQTIIGRDYLAEKWNWTPKTVRGFLDLLVDEGMIEKGPSKGRLANIATICNYEKYQSADQTQGPVEGTLRAGSGPVEGQTLTKDTNNTNKYTDTREREVVDFNDLSKSLFEACNGALADPCNAQGLLIMSHPLAWIEQGCDLQKDILPTLRAVSTVAHRNGKRIKSWDYFTNAVVEAKARREAPLPAPTLTTSDPPKRSMLPSELMALKRKQQQLETSGETNG